MLFKQIHLAGIAEGHITEAFRVWKRPTVKTGGTLTTAVGVLAIDEVAPVSLDFITSHHASAAGFAQRGDLVAELEKRSGKPDTQLYRVVFHWVGEDPRVALRNDPSWSDEDANALSARFAKMDERSKDGPWTQRVLQLIAHSPQVRAPKLAPQVGMDTKTFKDRVRKLKGHGLTESLSVGYRLSPRGEAFWLRVRPAGAASGPTHRAQTASDADKATILALIEEAGCALQAAQGPLTTLTTVMAGEPVTKSWLGHAKAVYMGEVFAFLEAHPDVLMCRVCAGKKTLVHRRVWADLLTLSPRLNAGSTDAVHDAQQGRGAQRLTTTPLAAFVGDDVRAAASARSEEDAIAALGPWIVSMLDR